MAKLSKNLFVPSDYSIWTAPFGAAAPTSPTTAPSASYYEVGLLSDGGITEAHGINESKIYDMVGRLLRTARNQEERPFTFEAVEDSRAVRELRFPGSTQTSTAGTAEVQTITSTATGGTFTINLPGYGASAGNTYNVATAALATALTTAFGITVAVTGTAGTSYVLTFPAASGNVPSVVIDNSLLTGGTASVVTTTPGVAGVNTRPVGSGLAQNLRSFLIYMNDGLRTKLFAVNNGEAVWTGTVGYTGTGASISQFTLQPYLDSNLNYFTLIDNDPAQTVAYA